MPSHYLCGADNHFLLNSAAIFPQATFLCVFYKLSTNIQTPLVLGHTQFASAVLDLVSLCK